MKHLRLALSVLCLTAAAARADGPPSLSSPELGAGPYSLMHMRLQKTILKGSNSPV